MSYQAVEAVMQRSQTVGTERLVLMVIATHADAETLTAYLGETTLCREANVKERNLRYTLAKLKASGELECVVGGGRGRANLYRLTLPQSDKGAEDCPVSNNQMEQEKGQHSAPLSDQRGQSVAGFRVLKGGNPSSEKGQPIVKRGQPVVEKGQPIAPQPLEPEEPKGTDAAARDPGDPLACAAVKLYADLIRPEPGLSIRQAELVAAEVTRLDVWRTVLVLFAGNEHRGRDGTGRQVGYALDRYRKEVDKANADAAAGVPGAKPSPPKAFSCPHCKGSGEVVRMNHQTREDERIPCSCQTRLTTSTGAQQRPAMTR
jgi:hypothetical protein